MEANPLNGVPLCDAHAHAGTAREIALRRRMDILTALCATDPADARAVDALCTGGAPFFPTYGLHPWKASRFSAREMEIWFERCRVIGEIGMDSVWCDVPAADQRAAFVRQLDVAKEMGKPVLLHTKGCEEEIARILAGYGLTCVVHWYSCDRHLDRYLDLDSYFTLGPGVFADPAVREVARRAPRGRLLVETDGLSAAQWALGREVPPEETGALLAAMLREAALLRGVSPETMRAEAHAAFCALYGA